MRRLLAHSFTFILIVASICYVYAFTMAQIYGVEIYELMNISQKFVHIGNYTATFYIFDLKGYLQNLGEDANIVFNIAIPNFPRMWIPTSWDISVIVKVYYNIMIWYINVLIWLINILVIFPTKLILQPFMFLFTILGLNTNKIGMYKTVAYLYTLNIKTLSYWA